MTRPPGTARAALFLMLSAALGVLASRAIAAEPHASHAPTKFRRVFVPADRVSEWPLKNIPYKTVPPDEFEGWIRQIEETVNDPSGAPLAARVSAAHYSAAWDGAQRLYGEARLTLAHLARSPAILPLEPCNLALAGARWADVDEASESDTPTVGLDSARRLAVLVDRSGTLILDWQVANRVTSTGGATFDLQLPRGVESTLDLTVPTGWRVEASQGIVTPPLVASAATSQVWHLELGGHTSTTLTFAAADAAAPMDQTIVRQSSVYDISLRGVELAVQLELDVRDQALRELKVQVPGPLRLVSARLGEERLSWTGAEGAASADDSTIMLHFDEPLLGTKRVVRLQAVAPLVVDQRQALPVCRPLEVFWQEGSVTLRIDELLYAEDLRTTNARQTSIGPLAEPQRGDAVGIQFFESDAQVELTLRPAHAIAESDRVALYESSSTEILGRLSAQIRLSRGESFELAAQILPGWNVESLEVTPTGMLADWRVEPAPGGAARLVLDLTEPITVDRSIVVRLAARRLRSDLHGSLPLDELRIARFEQVKNRFDLVALATAAAERLEFDAGTAPPTLDSSARGSLDPGLFQGEVDLVYYDLSAAPADAAVHVATERPGYTANVSVEVIADGSQLVESTTIECLPAGSRVERVFVQFVPPREQPPTWQQGDDNGTWFTAQRLTEKQLRDAGFQSQDEIWEIQLRQPRSVAFTLEAVRSTRRGDTEAISLASLPEATSQAATLTIGTSAAEHIRVENRRLQPIPPPSATTTSPLIASFRYAANDVVNAGADHAVIVHRMPATTGESSGVVWSSYLDSHYDGHGTGQHVATMRLARQGRDRLALGLPPGAQVREVRLDGLSLPRFLDASTLNIPLSAASADSAIEIHYSTPDSDWGTVSALVDPALRLPDGLPRLNHTWRVSLPQRFDLLTPPADTRSVESWRDAWRERWFGLFAWGPREEAFLPWSRDDWYALVAGDGQATQVDRAVAMVLTALGNNTPATSNRPNNWGNLVQSAAHSLRQAEWNLLVDAQALLDIGITSATTPATPTATQVHDRGAARLSSAGLVLLVHDRSLLLTTARRGAEHSREIVDVSSQHATWSMLRDGELARRIHRPSNPASTSSFVSATGWTHRSRPATTPVSHVLVSPPGPLDGTTYVLAGTDLTPSRTVVRMDRLRTVAWVLFAIVLAWGWPQRQSARGIWIVVALGSAAAALVVPAAVALLFSAVLVSALALLVAGLLRPPTLVERTTGRDSFTSRSLPSTRTRAPLLLLALLGIATRGHAAPPVADAPFEVLIPVDAERRPTGARYQVPEALHAQLQELILRNKTGPQGALIESALYRAEWSALADQPTNSVGQITAIYDLHVLGSMRRISLPFERERSGIVPNSAKLDGLQCETEWLDDGTQLAFDVPGPGRYRLELTLQPSTTTTAGQRGISLAIPPVPMSRLEIELPAAMPTLAAPSALGSVELDDDRNTFLAELGPTDRLELTWREVGTGTRSGSPGEVEQLVWLQVRPGAVVVDVRVDYGEIEPGVNLLEWEIDPRLRLIPADNLENRGPRVRTAADAPHKVQFELPAQPPGPLTLAARFLYTEASGVGNLGLPHIVPVSADVTKSWLAVSADSSLDTQVLHGDDISAFDAEKFLAAWAVPAEQPPWRVFSLPTTPSEWQLVTRPKPFESTVADRLDLGVDRQRTFVDYQAEIEAGSGTCFQHVVDIAPLIEVDEVAVREGTEDRLLRWSRDEAGRATLLLSRAAEGTQTLHIRGSFPSASPADLVLPRIDVAGARRTSAQLRVFRRTGVMVEVEPSGAIANLPAPDVPRQDAQLGNLVRAFRAERAEDWSGEVRLRSRDNAPQVHLRQSTVLRRDKESWQVDLEVDLRASGGLIDEIQFRVPPAWSEPYAVEPAVASTALAEHGTERTLTLRFNPPVAEQSRFTIRAPLVTPGADGLSIPDIEPLHVAEVERFVSLPKLVDFATINWDTRGLVEAPRPEELSTSAFPQSEHITYRVQAPHFEARLATLEPSAALPRVHLMDVAVTFDTQVGVLGAAEFLLEPAGLTRCPLDLPPGQRLLSASVGGTPAMLDRDEAGQYHMLLHHDRLPQRVEILFLDENQSGSLTAPTLGDLPVAQTLWTVTSEKDMQPTTGTPSELPAVRRQLLRLSVAADLLDLGAARSTDVVPTDYQNWLRPWRQSIELTRADLGRAREGVSPELATSVDAEMARLEEEMRVGSLEGTAADSTDTHDAAAAPQPVVRIESSSASRKTWSFPGAQSHVAWHRRAPRLVATRYLTPAVLAVAALLLASLVGGRILSDWTWRWPHFIGVAIGLIWWLWLWPSFLGLLLAVASALLATRVVRRPVVLNDRSASRYRALS